MEKVHLLPDHTFLGVGTTGYSVPYNYAQLHLDSTLENILSFTEHQTEEDTLIYNGQNMISSYLDAEQQMVVSLTNDIISGPNVNSDAWVIKSDVDGEIIWKIQLELILSKVKFSSYFWMPIFPNPFETEVSIQYNEPNTKKEALRLDVYSSSGMKIYEGAVINRIYLQHLPAGMYYFILTDRSLSKSFVRKVAKR